MIFAKADITTNAKAVEKAADVATYKNVGHAAASLRKLAIASLEKVDGPSSPGKPPHTHQSQRAAKIRKLNSHRKKRGRATVKVPKSFVLANAIVYAQENGAAVVGPRKSVAGMIGETHEFGGQYKGAQYPERPFMGPALDKSRDRFAASFAGSIGS